MTAPAKIRTAPQPSIGAATQVEVSTAKHQVTGVRVVMIEAVGVGGSVMVPLTAAEAWKLARTLIHFANEIEPPRARRKNEE